MLKTGLCLCHMAQPELITPQTVGPRRPCRSHWARDSSVIAGKARAQREEEACSGSHGPAPPGRAQAESGTHSLSGSCYAALIPNWMDLVRLHLTLQTLPFWRAGTLLPPVCTCTGHRGTYGRRDIIELSGNRCFMAVTMTVFKEVH